MFLSFIKKTESSKLSGSVYELEDSISKTGKNWSCHYHNCFGYNHYKRFNTFDEAVAFMEQHGYEKVVAIAANGQEIQIGHAYRMADTETGEVTVHIVEGIKMGKCQPEVQILGTHATIPTQYVLSEV